VFPHPVTAAQVAQLVCRMKSTEVYASLRSELTPLLKSLGFNRGKALLSWARQHNGRYTVLWCQVSRDGWDEYAGSKFVVELQRSESPEAGARSSTRARIVRLLTDDQRDEVWRLQNQVISGLVHPPRTHPSLHVSLEVTNWYLKRFDLVPVRYRAEDDVWLRYAKPEHLKIWAELLRRVLPGCVASIEATGAT
jgi:hypothetical protein